MARHVAHKIKGHLFAVLYLATGVVVSIINILPHVKCELPFQRIDESQLEDF